MLTGEKAAKNCFRRRQARRTNQAKWPAYSEVLFLLTQDEIEKADGAVGFSN